MRRVLLTAAASPLLSAVAGTLLSRPDIEPVVLVDAHHPSPPPGAETITVGGGYREIRDTIAEHRIDTVVHGALTTDRLGHGSQGREAEVIATMQVAAVAADLGGPVRNLVALSSTARYRASPGAAQYRDEWDDVRPPREGTYAASLAEAEDYLVALASQRPNLAVCTLRLADLVGPSVTSPLTALLQAPITPRYLGFDPMVQFLHVDDAVGAIEHAMERELAGTFNVASRGVIQWSRAIRHSGSLPYAVLPPGLDPTAGIQRALGMGPVPVSEMQTLQFGRVASTDRLEAAGFVAEHTVDDCVRAIRASRRTAWPSPLIA